MSVGLCGGVEGVCWAGAVCGNLLNSGGEYVLLVRPVTEVTKRSNDAIHCLY